MSYITTPPRFDIRNRRFGRLRVLGAVSKGRGGYRWRCRCRCGKLVVVLRNSLSSGNTRSCGCLMSEAVVAAHTTHGLCRRHPLYGVWVQMRQRCNNPNSDSWRKYGGRGIRVCRRWDDFAAFARDVGARPKGASLDRVDNDGNYTPGNTRWATPIEQAANTRRANKVTYAGKMLTLAAWATRTGLRHATLLRRLTAGWPVEAMLRVPTWKHHKTYCGPLLTVDLS